MDAILFATGYRYSICAPVWLANLLRAPRYLHVWPVADPTDVAFVGFVRPYLTSIPMLIEISVLLKVCGFENLHI